MIRTIPLAALALAAALIGVPALADPAPVQVAQAGGWDPEITEFDRVLGAEDAPVTIIEYASFTCPHCAAFHNDTLPGIKERYIDTGVARLVFRDFPLDGVALRAGMMARCAPEEQYFNLITVLFQTQRQWATADDPVKALAQIAGMAGMGAEQFQACMADEALGNAIIELRQEAVQTYDVQATPTFIINGDKVEGAPPADQFAALIDKAAPAR